MSLDLSELTIIRLQTQLENAIGFREYFLTTQDLHAYHVWDVEVEKILDEIIELGA